MEEILLPQKWLFLDAECQVHFWHDKLEMTRIKDPYNSVCGIEKQLLTNICTSSCHWPNDPLCLTNVRSVLEWQMIQCCGWRWVTATKIWQPLLTLIWILVADWQMSGPFFHDTWWRSLEQINLCCHVTAPCNTSDNMNFRFIWIVLWCTFKHQMASYNNWASTGYH